jgi:hypothetical protein
MRATFPATASLGPSTVFFYPAVEASLLKVDIKKDGEVITDSSVDVVVGEKINLEGTVQPSGFALGSKQWTIPNSGEIIKYWEPTWNPTGGKDGSGALEAHIEPVTTFDQSTISFYWVDGSFSGNSREIKYKVVVNGIDCEAKATFRVHRPTAQVTVSSDHVYLDHPNYKPGHWLHCGFGALGPRGVAASQTITVPTGFTSFDRADYHDGSHWVQLGNVNREKKESGVWYAWKSGGYYIDQEFPYSVDDFNDSPAQQLESSGLFQYSEVKVIGEAYKTWLLWRPAGTDTIDVPLKRIDWSWSGHVQKSGGTWSLISSSDPSPSTIDTTLHPEWTWTIPNDVADVPLP